MRNIIASVDIGSSSIKIVLSEVTNGKINVLHSRVVPTEHVKNAEIVNQAAVSEQIRNTINEINQVMRVNITHVSLVVPTKGMKAVKTTASIEILNDYGQVTKGDADKLFADSTKQITDNKFTAVTSVPYRYLTADGQTFEKAPIGVNTKTLTIETINYMIPSNIYMQYVSAINLAGLSILNVTTTANAIASEAITEFELSNKVLVIDMGHTSTTASLFANSMLIGSHTVPFGGKHVTNDIQQVMGVSFARAEKFKVCFGEVESTSIQPIARKEENGVMETYTISTLNQIMAARIQEIFEDINNFLSAHTQNDRFSIILVGGASDIKNIEQIGVQVFGQDIRRYRPDTIGAREACMTPSLGTIYTYYTQLKAQPTKQISLSFVEEQSLFMVEKKSLVSRFFGLVTNNAKAQKGRG